MKNQLLVLTLTTSLALALVPSAHALPIVNGGFETGNFTGWSQSGNTDWTDVTFSSDYVYSGIYGAQLGPVGNLGYISQTLSTVASQTYDISFWLKTRGPTPNEFQVQWGGTVLFDQVDIAAGDWIQYTITATAASSSTDIKFGFRNDPDFFGLDDISVTAAAAVPEASCTLSLLGLAVFGLAVLRRKLS